ncbi:MAG: hypothetical protein ACXAE3_10290 [Candidatus Kariarchaeaceae archaeon]|jgi:hypothetical protein
MSSEEFYGRPLSPGVESLDFDVCEVCLRRSPEWLEVQYENNVPVVRFTCDECHQEYISRDTTTKRNIARQATEDDNIEEAVRPGWVDEFIKEGADTGIISTLDEPSTLESSPITYAEAPQSFQEAPSEIPEEVEESHTQIAVWAPKFVQESLFGPNPEAWLEEQDAYSEDNLQITIATLGSMATNDVSSVKLSAIMCLSGVVRRKSSAKEDVLEKLKEYAADPDTTVADFAKQTMNQLN